MFKAASCGVKQQRRHAPVVSVTLCVRIVIFPRALNLFTLAARSGPENWQFCAPFCPIHTHSLGRCERDMRERFAWCWNATAARHQSLVCDRQRLEWMLHEPLAIVESENDWRGFTGKEGKGLKGLKHVSKQSVSSIRLASKFQNWSTLEGVWYEMVK